MSDEASAHVLNLTAQIVAAHVGKNQLAPEGLCSLIKAVYKSLSTVGDPERAPMVPPTPAVPIKKSVFPDHIVCLEDGKKLKMLKRHLNSFNMTPDQYRAKWQLPPDYPMVAPNYATTRSALAKSFGLGRKKAEPEITVVPARRVRGSKD